MTTSTTSPPLTPTQRDLLHAAANLRLSGVDLRFEGGPWVREADRLADAGLLGVGPRHGLHGLVHADRGGSGGA